MLLHREVVRAEQQSSSYPRENSSARLLRQWFGSAEFPQSINICHALSLINLMLIELFRAKLVPLSTPTSAMRRLDGGAW